jgi:hypothetical protein
MDRIAFRKRPRKFSAKNSSGDRKPIKNTTFFREEAAVNRVQTLTKQAREYILTLMREKGEMSTEEAIEIVRPHLILDPQELIRAETLRAVQRVMRSVKGESGKRA